jgi:sterol desaturase/sphingolipid hydroxylase (fatty acid hydroxylase superfamily)
MLMFQTYPITDWIGPPILLVLFVIIFASEKLRPLRRRVQHWFRRAWINLVVAVPAFLVLRLQLIPVVVSVAAWAGRHDLGLARIVRLPPLLAAIVAILVLDYSMFVWHWLNHRVPFLWRFHYVHHSDLDLDVTTAFRFHFGEILFSVVMRSLQVVLSGASPTVALVYEILLEGSTEFHHSNLRLPATVDRNTRLVHHDAAYARDSPLRHSRGNEQQFLKLPHCLGSPARHVPSRRGTGGNNDRCARYPRSA